MRYPTALGRQGDGTERGVFGASAEGELRRWQVECLRVHPCLVQALALEYSHTVKVLDVCWHGGEL